MKITEITKLIERLPRSQQWRGMCDDSCECEACALDKVHDLLPKLLAVAEVAARLRLYGSINCPECASGYGPCYCTDVWEAGLELDQALAALEAP